jgi:hypothetical protein
VHGETRCILPSDVSRVCQSINGRKRVAHSHAFILTTVNQLKQLNGEFDVAQTAWTEFDLSIDLSGRNVLHDALARLQQLASASVPVASRMLHMRLKRQKDRRCAPAHGRIVKAAG